MGSIASCMLLRRYRVASFNCYLWQYKAASFKNTACKHVAVATVTN